MYDKEDKHGHNDKPKDVPIQLVRTQDLMKVTFYPFLNRGLRTKVYMHSHDQLCDALGKIQKVLPSGWSTHIEVKFFEVEKDDHCRQMFVENKNESQSEKVAGSMEDTGNKV